MGTDLRIWILTEEYNDYDQHGEYYVAAFKDKPTAAQIAAHTGYHEEGVEHVLNGGGRQRYDHHWYNLQEVDIA